MNRTIIKRLSYLGAAINQGQPLTGVKKGPDTIRQCGVFETLQKIHKISIQDHGNISIDSLSPSQKSQKPIDHLVNNLHILDPLLKKLNQKLYQLHTNKKQGDIIVTVGGDHSIGSATINAALRAHHDLKVIWVDAHPDFVNPYLKGTRNQNYHGMPLSHVTGVHQLPGFQWMREKLKFENVVMIGVRDIDPDEYISIAKHKIKAYSMQHITKYGIGQILTQSLKYLDPTQSSPFHISFDLDAVDPYLASQTGTVFRDGLSHRESCHIVRRVVNQRKLVSMDLVEINPEQGVNVNRPRFREEGEYREDMSQSVGVIGSLMTSLCHKTLTL